MLDGVGRQLVDRQRQADRGLGQDRQIGAVEGESSRVAANGFIDSRYAPCVDFGI